MEGKEFFITSIGGLRDTADLIVTRETFNQNIKLSNFGKGVKSIVFHLLTFKENDGIHTPKWYYKKRQQEIFGRLPLDYDKAASLTDREAQMVVAQAFFDLFDKIKSEVEGYDFEGLKKAMLEAIANNPSFAKKSRFRVYSDYEIPTGDLPEYSKAIHPTKYGNGVKKLFVTLALFKKPENWRNTPPRFDKNQKGLYLSILSSINITDFSAELDRNIDLIKAEIQDFDFELLKADLLNFAEGLKVAA